MKRLEGELQQARAETGSRVDELQKELVSARSELEQAQKEVGSLKEQLEAKAGAGQVEEAAGAKAELEQAQAALKEAQEKATGKEKVGCQLEVDMSNGKMANSSFFFLSFLLHRHWYKFSYNIGQYRYSQKLADIPITDIKTALQPITVHN